MFKHKTPRILFIATNVIIALLCALSFFTQTLSYNFLLFMCLLDSICLVVSDYLDSKILKEVNRIKQCKQ